MPHHVRDGGASISKNLDYHGSLDLLSKPTREKNEELFDTLSYFHHPVAVRAVAGQKLLSDDPSRHIQYSLAQNTLKLHTVC